jgi:hypothetical protein
MPRLVRRLLLLLTLVDPVAGCARPDPAPSAAEAAGPCWFTDVTEKVGLDFVHDAGPTDGQYFLPQIVGSGAALFDFDGDGRTDVYLLQNGGPKGARNQLYRQQPDGTFRNVSAGSRLDFAGYCMGVAVGDVNNDSRPDVLVTMYGGVRLFGNNGDGTFTDVTGEAGLDSLHWGASACFVDYDRDGWLDLVVVNYVSYDPGRPCATPREQRDFCSPSQFVGTATKLYHNRGRGPDGAVHFEDVTVPSGLDFVPGPGLGIFCTDFDGDGWPDLFVANDGAPNRLWINQKNGTFKEEAVFRGVAYNGMGKAQAGMGVAPGDVNADGLLDLLVTHLTDETNTLWVQGPCGVFQDRTAHSALSDSAGRGTGWGTVLADFDQDGTLDLAVVNGRVYVNHHAEVDALGPFWGRYAERNRLWAGCGDGRFRDVSSANPSFCGPLGNARGLACGDVDGDGALDLLVTNVAGKARLYRNTAAGRGHWLRVRAVDPALNRDAYGAEVTAYAGSQRWRRWAQPASSYLCSNDPRVHFGLGPSDRVDRLEVLWPDGDRETFPGRAADQAVVLRKGEGRQHHDPVSK